jgi:hypothetical protein
LLKQLHELVEKACDGLLESKGQDEVNEDDMNDPTNEVGPMNEVDGGDEMMSTPVKTRGRGVKRKRNVGKGKRFVAELPETCRELDPKCKKMRSVTLFLEDRKKIWLALEDVNWAIKNLCAQHALRGVEFVPGYSTGPRGTAESPAVAGSGDASGESTN